MQEEDAAAIAEWVGSGGVLMLFSNDPANADIDHLNVLSERFGMHFNSVLRNTVDHNDVHTAKVLIAGDGPIFHDPHTAFMKEICTLTVTSPAVAQLRDRGDVLMATAKHGKGTVFATVDPWLYNEYVDGCNLPADFDNHAAGKELVRWVLRALPCAPTTGD